MKILNIPKISLFLFIIFACKENKQDKIESVFAGETSKKWYAYSIDSIHCAQAFYPFRVFEFFKDGRQIQYINNYTTKNLDTIPKDDLYNPEKWFIISDSIVSIDSYKNSKNGYYHKNTSKILYYNKDTIILQGTKRSNYEGVLILTRYKEKEKNK
ncbi:hypothetical protein B0A69_01580 [Chryseobacterium shigense]|uniref:Lipocalin-like domain-containing protein n=1 Tax=Chryseobacterium shigense TaxID=297244 RepID=A0A1N7IAB5_9FLAO|nr:hypothetical protein [Chryseobacterium shigense]PQA96787.1 hypothetical protein B0A69_01580 [Chryseobacterium shigense]SIS34009.1 hypothetical protein SAMN05421639_102815 [Chryseobacterium shigense]